MIDPGVIRTQFPIFDQDNGKPLIYLDNAATTHKPRKVIDCVETFYARKNANIHRGIYRLAVEATAMYEASRSTVADFLNAAGPEEIIFTSGATESINLVARSFAEPLLEEGDEVLISAMEHHSNLIPWQMVCRRKKARLKIIPMDERGALSLSTLPDLFTERTKMMAIVHISNSLGTINPVHQLIQMARQRSVPILLDAAQSAACYPLDVQELGCDFLVFSGHKVFGPTGTGVLYGKAQHLKTMEPYAYGGEMIRSVRYEETIFADIPHKFEAGTPNIAGVAGLACALDFVNSIGREAIKAHLAELVEAATQQLQSVKGLRIYGEAPEKSGIISFTLDRIHPHDIATFLNEDDIAIRAGHHCTQPVMDFYGIPATARVSFSIYNELEEIDLLMLALKKVQKFFGAT